MSPSSAPRQVTSLSDSNINMSQPRSLEEAFSHLTHFSWLGLCCKFCRRRDREPFPPRVDLTLPSRQAKLPELSSANRRAGTHYILGWKISTTWLHQFGINAAWARIHDRAGHVCSEYCKVGFEELKIGSGFQNLSLLAPLPECLTEFGVEFHPITPRTVMIGITSTATYSPFYFRFTQAQYDWLVYRIGEDAIWYADTFHENNADAIEAWYQSFVPEVPVHSSGEYEDSLSEDEVDDSGGDSSCRWGHRCNECDDCIFGC